MAAIIIIFAIAFLLCYIYTLIAKGKESNLCKTRKSAFVVAKHQYANKRITYNADAKVQKLKYFCIKDKGCHVTVWPKGYVQLDIVEFRIAGISHRENINNYLGECIGKLEAESTNTYDPNAIKVLARDGHHVGYVPKDFTSEVRKAVTLPCTCYIYIGINDNKYYSDCYVIRK